MSAVNFTTPVGRLVQGSLYVPNDKDADGNMRVYKSGPNLGKPRPEFYVAIAIPKELDPATGQVKHWATSEWGAKIWQVGHAFMAQAGQMPAFAWKIRDGDSTIPNRKQKRPVDQEGFKGCWIVGFASGFAPKCYTLINQPPREPLLIVGTDGQPLKDAINLGDYAQVNGNIESNDSQQQPGVYLNLSMVCLAGYGQRIVVGPDVSQAGFGGAPLPAGASTVPPGGFQNAQPPGPATPAAPGTAYSNAQTNQTPAPPGTAPSTTAPQTPPAPGSVAPNPQFLAPGGAAPLPPGAGAPPPLPPAAAHVMLPAANGASYETMIGLGWTDVLLKQHGMMA